MADTPDELTGAPIDFPWELMFSKDALKRAVHEVLGGAEVEDVTIFPDVQKWDLGAAVYLRYLLKNGATGGAKFVIFVQPSEHGIQLHFEAQTIMSDRAPS